MTKDVLQKQNTKLLSFLNNVSLGLSVGLPVLLHYEPQQYEFMHLLSAVNAIHALSNAVILSTGIYDLSKQKRSNTIDSMLISFGLFGTLGYGLSKFSTERSMMKYSQKMKQNIEHTTDAFFDLPPEKRRLNLYHLRNEAAKHYFPLSEEKSSLFLKSYSLSTHDTVVPPEGDLLAQCQYLTREQFMRSTMKSLQRPLDLVGEPEINLATYIEEDLILRRDLPQEQENLFSPFPYNVRNLSYIYHQESRRLYDLINIQQKYNRVQFSKYLLYDSLLKGVNAGFSYAGGIVGLYNYFDKKKGEKPSAKDFFI